jgi:hypothetical protein
MQQGIAIAPTFKKSQKLTSNFSLRNAMSHRIVARDPVIERLGARYAHLDCRQLRILAVNKGRRHSQLFRYTEFLWLVKIGDKRKAWCMSGYIKLDQDFLIPGLRVEIHLIATGIFPTGEIETVGVLEDLADIQIVRPSRQYCETDNSSVRTKYEFGVLTK